MNKIKIFSPGTVANLSCGFDVLGCCLDNVGDFMSISKNDDQEVRITKLTGQDLPMEANKNVASVAVIAMLKSLGSKQGFDIEIEKKIKAGSGIGSSAASAAGAVFAVNKILGEPCNCQELISFAMEGERIACGNAHADNVAPALLGGFTLVRSYEPLEVLSLPSLAELRMVVLHPLIEIRTEDARSILKETISLKSAVNQSGNLGAFVSALYTEDYQLLSRSLKDDIIEPIRSILIPYYNELKALALKEGALGFGISGSGPSVFALCKGDENSEQVQQAILKYYEDKNIEFEIHSSKINQSGIKIIS